MSLRYKINKFIFGRACKKCGRRMNHTIFYLEDGKIRGHYIICLGCMNKEKIVREERQDAEEERLEKFRGNVVYIGVDEYDDTYTFDINEICHILVKNAPEYIIIRDIREWIKLNKERNPDSIIRPSDIATYILKKREYGAKLVERIIGCPDINISLNKRRDELSIRSKNDFLLIKSGEIIKDKKEREQ